MTGYTPNIFILLSIQMKAINLFWQEITMEKGTICN